MRKENCEFNKVCCYFFTTLATSHWLDTVMQRVLINQVPFTLTKSIQYKP